MAEIQLITGDCREVLRGLPEKSVHCCTTSPPYWGLRDYGLPLLVWGGDAECEHEWGMHQTGRVTGGGDRLPDSKWKNVAPDGQYDSQSVRSFCLKCGAWRGSLGLEPTPELYVEHLVEAFREVKRVLRDDGTLWLNLGDSYNSQGGHTQVEADGRANRAARSQMKGANVRNLKPKDLVGIPWRVAFALQADGWWLRSDIIWAKSNPMPESVRDRPTKSHEYLFLLAKSKRYYYDQDAIRELHQTVLHAPGNKTTGRIELGNRRRTGGTLEPNRVWGDPAGRNKRTVWTIPTKPFRGAHFAVFPPALIEPCILAGTSEYGVCPVCGAPWERIRENTGHINKREPAHCPNNSLTKVDSTGWAPTTRATDTWRSTCDHDTEPIPATVLDPFSGAGTTGVVAAIHGRGHVGIELNPEYNEMARKRLAEVQPKLL